MQIATPLNNCSDNYLSKNIVVSLDDKYVVVFEETGDKIVVISDESESHDRFEIPECKIIMATTSSTGNRMILDLEYADILKYKTDY